MIGDPCYQGGNRHDFEPRYDEADSGRDVNVTNNYIDSGNRMENEELRKLRGMFVLKKYVCDICTWCGKTIKREG